MSTRARFTFMLERTLLYRLQAIQARTGLSIAQQIRESIQTWLEIRETRETPDADIAVPEADSKGRHDRPG